MINTVYCNKTDNIQLRNVQLCNKTSQQITRFLWNPEVGYRVYNSPQLVTIFSQINPVQTPFPIYLISILILCPRLSLCYPSLLVPSGFPTKILRTFYFLPSTCAAHLTLTICGDIYTPGSSSVCNCLQSPVISSLLAPNFSLSNLSSLSQHPVLSLSILPSLSTPCPLSQYSVLSLSTLSSLSASCPLSQHPVLSLSAPSSLSQHPVLSLSTLSFLTAPCPLSQHTFLSLSAPCSFSQHPVLSLSTQSSLSAPSSLSLSAPCPLSQHPIPTLEHNQPVFFRSVTDQVSHPYKTRGRFI